jgi:hypothetical protein
MKTKNWSDTDYEVMRWHHSTLYSMSFPSESATLCFDIDYIIESASLNEFVFKVAPCLLIFNNISNLEIKIRGGNTMGFEINDILRKKKKLTTTEGRKLLWEYKIDLFDEGYITFNSTGFNQVILAQPITGSSMDFRKRELKDYVLLPHI